MARLLILFVLVISLLCHYDVVGLTATTTKTTAIFDRFKNAHVIAQDSLCSVRLMTKEDLRSAADIAFNSFYKPRVNLDTSGMSPMENLLFGSVMNKFLEMERFDSWSSNYLGFWNRSGNRLKRPSLQLMKDSLILVATKNENSNAIVGVIEVCMETPTGLLTPPLKLPWAPLLDSEQPYLCNLCIDKSVRRQGLGRCMCSVVEDIAKNEWGKDKMYLHVEAQNNAAQLLYESLNYKRLSLLSKRQTKENNLGGINFYEKNL